MLLKACKIIFISILLQSVLWKSVFAQNLIPDKLPGKAYDYFCTWAAQNYLYGWGADTLDLKKVILQNNASGFMHEKWLTGPEGWLSFYPKVRADLIFLLDDGYNTPEKDAMEVDERKFPSFKGEPAIRQKKLVELVKKAGWRGLGLWSRGIKDLPQARERVEWSYISEVSYWKVDGGDEKFIYDSLRNHINPALVLEHSEWPKISVYNNGPNGGLMLGYAPHLLKYLEGTDVVRIYDIDQPMAQVSGLARVAGLLAVANGDSKAKAIINCEDLVTVGAVLGCSFGVFRFPIIGKRSHGDPDIFNAGPRQTKKRMDDVTRAVRWHRIAPPFPCNAEPVIVDTAMLIDKMTIKLGETWDINIPTPLTQSAPARVSRGLPLADVKSQGELPFVLSSRNPNGAVSIGTFGRHSDNFGYRIPLADISQKLTTMPSAIGIFGRYHSLTINFPQSIAGKKVLAQDLAGDAATDVTKLVTINRHQLIIPGSVIEKAGLADATSGDVSDPGMVLVIQ